MPMLGYFAVAAWALFYAEIEICFENENHIFINSSSVFYEPTNIGISNSATKLMVPYIECFCDH